MIFQKLKTYLKKRKEKKVKIREENAYLYEILRQEARTGTRTSDLHSHYYPMKIYSRQPLTFPEPSAFSEENLVATHTMMTADGMTIINSGGSGGMARGFISAGTPSWGGVILTPRQTNSGHDYYVQANPFVIEDEKCGKGEHKPKGPIDIKKEKATCDVCGIRFKNPHFFKVKNLNTDIPAFSALDD